MKHGPYCSPPKDCYCGAIEAASPPSLEAPAEMKSSSSSTPIRDDQEGAASPLINRKNHRPASGPLPPVCAKCGYTYRERVGGAWVVVPCWNHVAGSRALANRIYAKAIWMSIVDVVREWLRLDVR